MINENSHIKTIIGFVLGVIACATSFAFLYNYELIPYVNRSKLDYQKDNYEKIIAGNRDSINLLNHKLSSCKQSTDIDKTKTQTVVKAKSIQHDNIITQTNENGDNIGGNKSEMLINK